MDVTVCVATFGEPSWADLANRRAIPSARVQTGEVVHVHGDTLHEARNQAAALAATDRVVFLDADDELEPGYLAAMTAVEGDVVVPQVRYVEPMRTGTPRFPRVAGHWHDCEADCLEYGNWVVIGAALYTDQLRAVGGFRDWPVYEDWDLMLRLHRAGATFARAPGAVYRAHVRPDSRNRGTLTPAEKHAVHQAIAADLGAPVPA